MAENSKIEWTAHTFNPWRGCRRVAPECDQCYAATMAKRNPATLGVWSDGDEPGTRVVAAEPYWRAPLKWDREAEHARKMNARYFPRMPHVRPRVFCASLADVFEEWDGIPTDSRGFAIVPGSGDTRWGHAGDGLQRIAFHDVRRRLFALIDATPNLDWLLLTKRPENIRRMWSNSVGNGEYAACDPPFARRNVWLGTSAGTQETADRAIPELLKCRDLSPVLFVSAEPLLGPLTLRTIGAYCTHGGRFGQNVLNQEYQHIDWVIVGGESGPKARPMELEWVESIADQCDAAGVPLFVKQDSGRRSGMRGRLSDALWRRKEFPTTTEETT